MRNFNILLFILLLTIPACQNFNTSLDPEIPPQDMNFLALPASSSNIAIEEIFTVNKSVDGKRGDTISFNFSYISESGSDVSISGLLKIQAGSFKNDLDFIILADQAQTFINFYPSPTEFDIPLELDLSYEGLNLNGIESNDLEFYYVNDIGNQLQIAEVTQLDIDKDLKKLTILGAKIPHFSRWGVGND